MDNNLEDRVRVLESQVKLLIQALEQATALIHLLEGKENETTKC